MKLSHVPQVPTAHDTDHNFSPYRMALMALFNLCMFMGSILGAKIVLVAGHPLGGGTFVFPWVFAILVIMGEVYGFRVGAWMAFWGVFNLAAAILLTYGIGAIPSYPPAFHHNREFDDLFRVTPRAFAGTIVGFSLGQLAAVGMLSFVAKRTQGRMLWLRITGAPMLAQMVTVLVAFPIVFTGVFPLPKIWPLLLFRLFLAIVTSLLMSFVIFPVCEWVREKERPRPIPSGRVPEDLRPD